VTEFLNFIREWNLLLVSVVGYFTHRLIRTQEKHSEVLANHEKRLEVAELRLDYVERNQP